VGGPTLTGVTFGRRKQKAGGRGEAVSWAGEQERRGTGSNLNNKFMKKEGESTSNRKGAEQLNNWTLLLNSPKYGTLMSHLTLGQGGIEGKVLSRFRAIGSNSVHEACETPFLGGG